MLPELCREGYEFLAQLDADWIGMPELPHVQTGPDASPEVVAAAGRRLDATESILMGMRGFLGGMGEGNNPTRPGTRGRGWVACGTRRATS
ncbi:hypothetical protein ADK61_09285 [Streptomyces sp. XY66]|nr:hypothetical protein ADK61_09285 [Streptomyces sp. XY66]